MAEEVVETGEPKPKKPILLIAVAVLLVLILLGGAVAGTLFFTGFFKPKPELTAEQQLEAEAASAAGGQGGQGGKEGVAKDKDGKPIKLTKKSPELTRFDYSYHQMQRDFLVNLAGSRKVMSVQIAVSTRYDQRVIDNVQKHEFALRSVVMDNMRQTVEADLLKPEFRQDLAIRIRDVMNTLLEKYEDFGGIEEVHFTSFIVQ